MSEPNHSGPAAPASGAPATPAGDRALGVFGLLVAVGIALIGADLLTGGALSRMIRVRGEGDSEDVQREG